jgi:ABC-type antimicrobial peptide transport system permease subunit
MEILGILGNIKEDSLNSDAYPYVYNCAMGGNWPDPEYVVRGSGDLRGAVRKLVKNVDPARVVFAMKDLREAVDGDLERPRANVRMVALFAGSAMLLAAIGIYGLVSQMVQSQRREIGVRMALGAEPGWILWSVVGPALGLAVVGAMVGFGLTFAARRTLESLLYGVKATDGWSLAAAAGMLIAVTLLAAWIPARRAAGIDPVEAIRAD